MIAWPFDKAYHLLHILLCEPDRNTSGAEAAPSQVPLALPLWPQHRQSSLGSALQPRMLLPIPDGRGRELYTYASISEIYY